MEKIGYHPTKYVRLLSDKQHLLFYWHLQKSIFYRPNQFLESQSINSIFFYKRLDVTCHENLMKTMESADKKVYTYARREGDFFLSAMIKDL